MPFIFNGQYGGLSNSKWSGFKGSFYRLVGIDGNSKPGILKIRQKLEKNSGATVTALCRVSLVASSGETFWFSYTDGKIWRRSTGGTWLLVYTTTPVAGGAGCLGAAEHDGYIYWATESRLHRIPITNIVTAANWTANVVEDWGTFSNTDASFHPMQRQGDSLFIGDANYVAKVSGATGAHAFTANALDIRTPHRIKALGVYGIDLLIGTFIHANVNRADVIRWDTESESWNIIDTVEENGVNAFIRDDNYTYVQAGRAGRIYYYDGSALVPAGRIPGDWSPTKTAEVYSQAVATHLTVPVFGLSNITGNPALQGVYSFGSYSKDYNKVMDLSFPVSAGLTSVEIGSILAVGANLLVSWYDGTDYGVDALNWAKKYPSAYIETGILTSVNIRSFFKNILKIIVNYAKILPDDCGISIKYKKKYEVAYSSAVTTIKDTDLVQERVKESIPKVAALQLRFDFTVKDNNAPEVEGIEYEL